MRLALHLLLAVCVLSLEGPRAAIAKGAPLRKRGTDAAKPPEWSDEAGRQIVHVFAPCPLKAYLAPPSAPDAEKKAELIVVLHGHGGTATGMLGYTSPIADARKAYCMACEGSGVEHTPQGEGHSWGETDVDGVLACLDAALAKYPIDPKRVVIMGHSAGGTMGLKTYAVRPAAFAGVYTTAAPMTPSSAQKGARVVVNLGTKDPNYQGFPAAVAASQGAVVGRIVAVEDLAHDLPASAYSEEAVAWLLDSKAPSEVLRLPFEPSTELAAPEGSPAAKGKGGKYRHVVRFFAGSRGAPHAALPEASVKAAIVALVKAVKERPKDVPPDLAKFLPEGRLPADFGDLVATASEDPLSKDLRGMVTGAVLARYGGPLLAAMAKLKGGDVSAAFESDAGWHLLYRDP